MARIGVILGAGGRVGMAYHAGVLAGITDVTGWDARRADLVVGTSAGSMIGAFLRAGIPAPDLAARGLGDPVSGTGVDLLQRAEAAWADSMEDSVRITGGSRRPPNARLPLRAMFPPWRTTPIAAVSGLVPAGTRPSSQITAGLHALFDGKGWPADDLWVCAVRMRDGRRTVFGRAGAPGADVPNAVAASCAIPGVFEPVRIDSDRYVDGGVHSTTNVDTARRADLDLAIVSAPMSVAGDARYLGVDAGMRGFTRASLGMEVRRLQRAGTRVLVFQPTKDEVGHMGLVSQFDSARRKRIISSATDAARTRLDRDDAADALAVLADP